MVGALPGWIVLALPELAVGGIAILLIASAGVVGYLIGGYASRLGWPLNIIVRFAADAWQLSVGVLVRWSEESANAVAHAIRAPFQAIWTVQYFAEIAVYRTALAAWHLRYEVVPAVRQEALDFAFQVGQLANRYAEQLHDHAIAFTQAVRAEALQFAFDVGQLANRYSEQLHGLAIAFTQAVRAEALQFAFDVGQLANRYAEALHALAIEHARSLFGEAVQHADAVGAQAERYAESIGAADVEYIRQVAGDLLRDIAGAEARANAYAGALAIPIAAAVAAIEDLPCIRACGPLGDLGGLLQGLEAAGLLALLLALVQDARSHPQDVERMLSVVFAEPLKDVAASFQLGISG